MKSHALPLWLGLMLLCSHPSIGQVTMPIEGTAYIGDGNYSDFTINDYMVYQASDDGLSVVAECTPGQVCDIDITTGDCPFGYFKINRCGGNYAGLRGDWISGGIELRASVYIPTSLTDVTGPVAVTGDITVQELLPAPDGGWTVGDDLFTTRFNATGTIRLIQF